MLKWQNNILKIPAENGGQITGQIYKNHLAEPLAEAAFSLNENEFSNVIEYQNAFLYFAGEANPQKS